MDSEQVAGWIVYDTENCADSCPKIFFDISDAIAYRKTLRDPLRWGIMLQYIRADRSDRKPADGKTVCGLIPDTCYEIVLDNTCTFPEKSLIWIDSLTGALNFAGKDGAWLWKWDPEPGLLRSIEVRKSHRFLLLFVNDMLELCRISSVETAMKRQLE